MLKLLVLILLLSHVCYGLEPVTTAAAAAAVPQIGAWGLAGASALGAGLTSAFNWFSARKSEQFSERMSNTAHQREVADLRAANLNPLLSAGGKGASSPQGSSASAGNFEAIQSAMAAAQIGKTKAETRMLDTQATMLEDEWAHVAGSVDRQMAIRGKLLQQINDGQLSGQNLRNAEETLKLIEAQIKETNARGRSSNAKSYRDEVINKPFEWGKNVIDYGTNAAKGVYEKFRKEEPYFDNKKRWKAPEWR